MTLDPKRAASTTPSNVKSWCRIGSFDDLEQQQDAILERIAAVPNGGNLFLLHPFMLLEEVGVAVSEDFKRLLVAQRPALATLSAEPYSALRGNPDAEQAVRVRLAGLFRREGHGKGGAR